MRRLVTITAPAKLNLGLEVVGRRPDGYYELVTIFQAVSIIDVLTLSPSPELTVDSPRTRLEPESNLIISALSALRQAADTERGAHVALDKRIPVAAGLGGGSSDAATALRLANETLAQPLPPADLSNIAAVVDLYEELSR